MKRVAERNLSTVAGIFREILFDFNGGDAIALVLGEILGREDVYCRLHSSCISAHVFNSVECTCREEMLAAQHQIAGHGAGVIIYLDQEGKGNGHRALIESIPYKQAGHSQAEAYVLAGYQADAREYSSAAYVLDDLGVRSVVLLSGGSGKAESLSQLGIVVSRVEPLVISDER